LKREPSTPIGGKEVEPISPGGIVLARKWRCMPLSIDEPEQLSPELCAGSRICRVKDDLCVLRNRWVLHAAKNIPGISFGAGSFCRYSL
jgi:hypothetical protein